MNEKKSLKIIDTNNKEIVYEILYSFTWTKTNKNYIIYTDNLYTNNKLNIYASIFYPKDNTKLDQIKTKEEWDEIYNKVNELRLGISNYE